MDTTRHLADAMWRKSSYSSDTGGNCVECAPVGALAWQKSSHSSDTGGNCIEVAEQPCLVAVRDSKVVDGPVFTVGHGAFAAFVRSVSA